MRDLKAIRFFYSGTKKVSHDYAGKDVKTFSMLDLTQRGVEMIGIPAKQNKLLIVDVDVPGGTHQHDGREWWARFCEEQGIPATYTVQTPSGGYHFYFSLPEAVNPDTFSPPAHPIEEGEAVLGVDFKYNGWVGAPPAPGYHAVYGTTNDIQELPPSFLAYLSNIIQGRADGSFTTDRLSAPVKFHTPLTEAQVQEVRHKIDWIRMNVALSRDEWRDGIFGLRAGITDEATLEELVTLWTMNQAYVEGDEVEALAIARDSDPFGAVGPGTLMNLLREIVQRNQAAHTVAPTGSASTPWTVQEILDKSRVSINFDRKGDLKIEPSESNAAALLGAIYDDKTLYYDSRNELCIFDGQSYSDTELVNRFLPMIQSPSSGLGLENFRAGTVRGGLDVLMERRKRDPHYEYLRSLTWDGTPRLATFMHDFLGVENNYYHQIVGVNFWTAMAARGLRPGCKFDSMLVLEGREGIRKSSFVSAIGGERYTFAPISHKAFEDLDELRKMHQSVIVELPEMIGLVGRPPEMVKGFLANPVDTIRDLFARRAKQAKRGFVIVGTTNSDKYLSRHMGIRRFWPVRIPDSTKYIDTDKIIELRDQLFAEAVAFYRSGHRYWEIDEDVLRGETATRVERDPITQCIENLVTGEQYLDVPGVFRRLEGSGYVGKGLDSRTSRRIEEALKILNYVEQDGLWVAVTPDPSLGVYPQLI